MNVADSILGKDVLILLQALYTKCCKYNIQYQAAMKYRRSFVVIIPSISLLFKVSL